MKTNRLSTVLIGLAACAGMSSAATAADWGYGAVRLKEYGSQAVPVPAPVPIPEYRARWYFRADIGLGLGADPSTSESGIVYTDSNPASPATTQSAWFNNDFDTFITGGVGVGYYWSRYFRTDLTAELRSQGDIRMRGELNYPEFAGGPPPVATGNTIVGPTRDTTELRSGVVLLNGYYDFARTGGFTPYAGAGIGFAVNELERRHDTSELVCPPASQPACTTGLAANTAPYSASDKQHTVTLAAAFMAGVTYHWTPNTALDINYRFMHIEGTHVDLTVNGNLSRLSIGDINEHQIRAGLRWDID